MKKKILFILAILLITIIALIICYNFKENFGIETEEDSEKEYEEMEIVESQITSLMKNEEYQKMAESEQIEAIKELLTSLSKQGLVKHIYFDKPTAMFSFDYKNGVGGGVMIRGFDPNLN